MGTESNFAETDLHILTFDIPDDALERAASAELAFTWVHCTSPLAWECPALTIGARRASSPAGPSKQEFVLKS
jgi:hypothetical protein